MPWTRSPRDAKPAGDDDTMTLTEHLAELRVRIIRSMLAVALGTIVVLAFYDQVLEVLTQPYQNLCDRKPDINATCVLNVFSPTEGFTTRFRISAYGGLILALPVVLWQIWRFVVPALHAKEKKYAIPFILSTVILFLLGGFLAYWTLDKALEFLIGWSGTEVISQFQISKYISLVFMMILAFGIGFEFPVLLVNVLVAAPTGAGKTVVAEHAVGAGTRRGAGKCFYTAPIKALSNQKFARPPASARRRPGRAADRRPLDQSRRAVVVMTTEVLRNMIYSRSAALEGLAGWCSTRSTSSRTRTAGPVWEEVLIHTPSGRGFVCLSATVSNADELATGSPSCEARRSR
jgi:sec-independent protein translocase protein TatC